MEILSNLSHLLASSRPPRSLSALLTGQLWKRLNIRVLENRVVLGLAGGGPGVVSVGVGLPVHAALLPPLAPVEHPEVARRTQRRVRVVLALQTLVTRLMGKIFLYYMKLFLKYTIRSIVCEDSCHPVIQVIWVIWVNWVIWVIQAVFLSSGLHVI